MQAQPPVPPSSPNSRSSCGATIGETITSCCRAGDCPTEVGKRVSLFEYAAEEYYDVQQVTTKETPPPVMSQSVMLPVQSSFAKNQAKNQRAWRQSSEIPVIVQDPGDERPPQLDQRKLNEDVAVVSGAAKPLEAIQELQVEVTLSKYLEHHVSEGEGSAVSVTESAVSSRRSSYGRDAKRHSVISRGSALIPLPKKGLLVGRCVSEDWFDAPTAISLRRLLFSKSWEFLSMVVLLFALFLSDLFELGQATGNTIPDVILLLCFCFFSLEIAVYTLAMEFYPNSFFFWMDLIGALSLIFDISFFLGVDAMQYESHGRTGTDDQAVLARASRVAKQASRAGRMSRMLKMLRFLPFLSSSTEDETEKKAARAISEKLTVNLSTRVAFLTIILVVVLPLFGMFVYPEVEDSFTAHVSFLSKDIAMYRMAPSELMRADLLDRVNLEIQRIVSLYSGLNAPYGPFRLCAKMSSTGNFTCDVDREGVSFHPTFDEPRRGSSVTEVTAEDVKLMFNMVSVRQFEALYNILILLATLVLMIGTCFFLSSSVGRVVLIPLERVLKIVREHCAKIVEVTARFHHEAQAQQDPNEDGFEDDEASEVVLLEKVLTRIAGALPKELLPSSVAQNEEDVHLYHGFIGQQFATMTGLDQKIVVPSADLMRNRTFSSNDSDAGFAALPSQLKAAIEQHSFNVWQVPEEQRESLVAYAISYCRFCSDWTRKQVPEFTLANFVETVKENYKQTAFHNFDHAIDVTFEVRRYLYDLKNCFFDEATYMCLLVAALGHDIGHPGVNNMFLVETSHEFAMTYNDRAPLENLHCCLLFQVLRKEENNVFQALSKDAFKKVRSRMVDAILHTDMIQHNGGIKDLGILYTLHTEAFQDGREQLVQLFNEEEQKQGTVLNALLHTADVSNPMKPWDLCQVLADKCLEEFFAQGDQEKAMGIPVQILNDRDKVNRANSQVGFIEFVIAPLAFQMATLFPRLSYLTASVGNNIQNWALTWKLATNPTEQEWQKVSRRVDKVRQRCDQIAAEANEKLSGMS